MPMMKTAILRWIDGQLKAKPALALEVEDLLIRMRLAQQLGAIRGKRRLSQRNFATEPPRGDALE